MKTIPFTKSFWSL